VLFNSYVNELSLHPDYHWPLPISEKKCQVDSCEDLIKKVEERKKKISQHSLKTVFLNMVNHSFIFRTAKLSNYNHIQRLAWYIPSHTPYYLVTSVCQSDFQLGTWQWNECISRAHFGASSPQLSVIILMLNIGSIYREKC